MKNVLLVFTGGTIGSSSQNGAIDPSNEAKYRLLDLFRQHCPNRNDVQFKTLQPFQLLSENLQPCIWEQLISVIQAENPNQYDGIIITHGTDTLAFSAAALGLYFNDLEIPMLLVSSNYPLTEPQANGVDNFICAVEFIIQQQKAGVYVPYKNPDQEMHLHIATRLLSSLPLSGNFISAQSRPFMQFKDGDFTPFHKINECKKPRKKLNASFSSKIRILRPYPGLDYSRIDLKKGDVILHDLYHSGTACASSGSGRQHSLSEFIQTCRLLEVEVYLAPALKHPDLYSSTRDLLDQGATMLWNMTLETAYVKLMLAYGNFDNRQDIGVFMQQDIAFEHL